jgi:hypothetical protein
MYRSAVAYWLRGAPTGIHGFRTFGQTRVRANARAESKRAANHGFRAKRYAAAHSVRAIRAGHVYRGGNCVVVRSSI